MYLVTCLPTLSLCSLPPQVRDALAGALSPSAPASLKVRCLAALTELLEAEEEALLGRQEAVQRAARERRDADSGAVVAVGVAGSKGGRGRGQEEEQEEGEEGGEEDGAGAAGNRGLARRNGEGDTGSVSSGLIQVGYGCYGGG